MPHISKTVAYSGIAVVSLFVIIASFWYKSESIKTKTQEELLATSLFITKGNMVTEQGSEYTVEGELPSIPFDVKGGKEATLSLAKLYRKKIEDFKQQAKQSYASAPNELIHDNVKSSYYLSSKKIAETKRYISILVEEETYFIGMAHPSHDLATYIFDKEKNKLVDVTTLFLEDSLYRQRLSSLSRAFFEQKNKNANRDDVVIDTTLDNEGFSATRENFGRLLPTPLGLIIYFKEYQIAPYAAGMQQALLPYDEILDDLDWEGVLGDYK